MENDYNSSIEEVSVDSPAKIDEVGLIVENIDELVFVCDIETDEIVYMNSIARKLSGIYEYKGKKCYEVMCGGCEHCKTCNRSSLNTKHFKKHEEHNKYLNRHLKISEKLIYIITSKSY